MKKRDIKNNRKLHSWMKNGLHLVCSLFASALLLALPSCQDDSDGTPGKPGDKEEITVNNNSEELSKRVTVYKTATVARGNSSSADINMPAAPDMNSINYDFDMSQGYEPWKVKNNDVYYLPEGKNVSSEIKLKNKTVYYIAGNLSTTDINGSGGTIIILPTGTFNCASTISDGAEILNYGTLNLQNGLTINKNADVRTVGSITCQNINVSGTLYVGGKLQVKTLTASETSMVVVECSAIIETNLTLSNNSFFAVRNYLKSPRIELNSSAKLEIKGGSLVQTDLLTLENPSCEVGVVGEEGNYAVVAAEKLNIRQSNVKKMFTGWMDIHSNNIHNLSGGSLEWLSNIKFNGDTYIPDNGCHPEFGTPAENEKSYELDHFAEIVSPDHQHDISSTSIQSVGNKAYVSYHTYGGQYGGCIEVVEISDPNICRIVSYLQSKSEIDFNHLTVDAGNRIWTVGGERKGAFLAHIDLQGGIFNTATAQLNKIRLEGASGNCVIRNGAFLQTASNAGYETFNVSDLSRVGYTETPGSAKFLHQNNDQIVTLTLADKNDQESGAVVNIYQSGDNALSSPVNTIQAGNIIPVNGKNVSKIDGDMVYVCLGQNGVKAFRNGTEVASFQVSDITAAAANGLDFDDQFIYVAYGLGGLYVLDKTDLSVVASYQHAGGKSANYITKGENGYIYVAYGLNGMQIFRLIEKDNSKD